MTISVNWANYQAWRCTNLDCWLAGWGVEILTLTQRVTVICTSHHIQIDTVGISWDDRDNYKHTQLIDSIGNTYLEFQARAVRSSN